MSAFIAIAEAVLPFGDDANQSKPSSNVDGVGKCVGWIGWVNFYKTATPL